MAHHSDLLRGVTLDNALDCIDHTSHPLVAGEFGVIPRPGEHGLPARVVRCLELFDRNVFVGVAVVLGDAIFGDDAQTVQSGERFCGLMRTPERARIDGVDRLPGQIRCQVLGLQVPVGGEFRIRPALAHGAAHGQSVSNEQQLHRTR